mmetsp:Transcript_29596/g.48356  ORF Transcript_29596/g.48356 Transcript_29596/m.48356 type:complete len:105 (-) Transcript_29596:88-402(-)
MRGNALVESGWGRNAETNSAEGLHVPIFRHGLQHSSKELPMPTPPPLLMMEEDNNTPLLQHQRKIAVVPVYRLLWSLGNLLKFYGKVDRSYWPIRTLPGGRKVT